MDICRLCLQPGGQIVQNYQEIIEILRYFFPYINSCLKLANPEFCETCLKNIQVVAIFKTSLRITNAKIKAEMERSKLDRVDLFNLIIPSDTSATKGSVCRICLKLVHEPQIFLYENDTNLFRYDLILNMFKFCKIILDCDIIEKPAMCLQCWENLQVCYSFKKHYLETDKKIRTFCIVFKLTKKTMTDKVIQQMGKYFLEQNDAIYTDVDVIIKKDIFCDKEENKGYSLRKRMKKEYCEALPDLDKVEEMPVRNIKREREINSKRSRHQYTNEEDEFLLKTYIKCNKTSFSVQPGKKVQQEWNDHFSENLSVRSINLRLKKLLGDKNKKSVPQTPAINQNYQTNNYGIKKNILSSSSADQVSDSEESFTGEVAMSSFMPHTKPEPLSDNDEIHIIESRTEYPDFPPSETESDVESLPLPLLERMDLPSMNFKIKDIYSLEVKRETLNMLSDNEGAPSNINEEELSTCKRIVLKDHNNQTIYKCMQCNFETKYQYSAERHSSWHAGPKKNGFKCDYCPFETSKYVLLKHHSTIHAEHNDVGDDDLPVLIPFTI